MFKAYKFRAYPTKEQRELIIKTFGCCRFYWNKALADNIEYYKENGKGKINTPAQYKKEFEFLKEVDSVALCFTQQDLQGAFAKFFKQSNAGFPKFKSKKSPKNSYKTMQTRGFEVGERYIKMTKLGKLRIKNHRNVVGICKSATISMDSTNKFYVSILFEEEEPIKDSKSNEIGIDLGLTDFVICSNGEKVKPLRSLKKGSKKLAKEQRKLSKMKKGSNNYLKQKEKVAKIHKKIANQRKDFLHKLSYRLVKENQLVCMEDLNVKGLVKNRHLAKAISDAGWSEFTTILEYKAGWYGSTIVKVDRFYPSSQICNVCGHRDGKKPLRIRKWVCPCCNNILDRDINAAKNILDEGKRIFECASRS